MQRAVRLAAALLAAVSFGLVPGTHAADDAFPRIGAAYLVAAHGQVLWARNAERRVAPASLTKIMTALLVLERERPDDVAAVGHAAAAETGSRLGLAAGELLRVSDLLAAALIASANDACHALADWHSGSERAFVEQMNRRAARLGLRATRFANACGHDASGHYSSARDLAALTEAALRHPAFAALVARASHTVHTVDGRRRFTLTNSNALIGRFPGAIGVKSGYTRKAGKCVIALAERDGVRVLLVLLDAPNRWWDAHGVLERAFATVAAQRGT
jgi:D-alanyl-D-alanine carboxypeptidase (penicillin-binding protein 5/6)